MAKEVIKRYSEAFKLQVVREYEAGVNLNELRQKYGIGGGNTVHEWVAQYSHQGLRHQLMVIQSPADQEEVKRLRQRVAQLEKAVAQLTLDKVMLEALVETAEKELGLPLKKNGAARLSSGPASAMPSRP